MEFASASLLFALVALVAPIWIAMARNRAIAPVAALTLLLGWTYVGWAAAMVWALSERTALEDFGLSRIDAERVSLGEEPLDRRIEVALVTAVGIIAGLVTQGALIVLLLRWMT